MGLSREARILTLLVIDTTFFFIEIISGYAVGSLALISDAFHMLNDVMSLVVAYYAVKLASKPSSSRNSYGWQRSEVLGALVNGVFLLALCFSIFMEAIERFFNVSEISQPKLVVIVGCLGLASNVIGLFLFHEHGHSHGHDHSHGSDETPTIVEPPSSPSGNRNTSISRTRSPSVPANRPSHGRSDSFGSLYGHPAQTRAAVIETAHEYGYGRQNGQGSISLGPGGAFSPRDNEGSGPLSPNGVNSFSHHVRTRSKGGKKNSISEEAGAVSPATTATAVEGHSHAHNGSHDHDHDDHSHSHSHDNSAKKSHKHDHAGENGHDHDHDHDHGNGKAMAHNHDEAEAGGHSHGHGGHSHGGGGGHGHSHGNMNMRGVFLHVLGDALGNVGVISAGLVIMFAEGHWKYYFDPAISLLITCIIFSSALPLVKSASYILLQGVPTHISLEDVRHGIRSVEGVLSLHELHVWQLSEKTVVASVHVLVSRDSDYMAVAEKIRQVLHDNGVHSSTIQPEFGDIGDADSDVNETACLIRCPPEDCGEDTCCPPPGGKLADAESNQGIGAQAGAPSAQ